MKTFITLFIFVGSLSTWATNASESKITEVTVFKDRAYVKRNQSVRLEKGAATIHFSGITPLADKDSLKVVLSEKSAVKVLGIRHENKFLLEARNKQLAELRAEEALLKQNERKYFQRASVLQHESENLQSLSTHYADSFSLNLHQNTWSKNSFKSFLDLWNGRHQSANGTWYKLLLEYDVHSKKLEMVQAKIDELSTPSEKQTLSVFVDVVAQDRVEVAVDLQYLVSNTGWTPTYDLRINSAAGNAMLEQNAYVWQNSGEDWTGVRLNLSNFRSVLNTQPPDIWPATIQFKEVKKVNTQVTTTSEDVNTISIEPQNAGTEKSEGEDALAKTFEVFGRHTVKDSMKKTKIFVAKKELPYKEHLEVVASQYQKVYRKGQLVNQFPWNLAEGTMFVYYNGNYINQTWLSSVAQGKNLSINAGVEHSLVVTKWENVESRKPSALSTTKQHIKAFFTRVENFESKPRQVRIMQQIPVSEIESVKVDFTTPEKQEKLQKDSENVGWYYWEVAIPPRQVKEMSVTLEVATPNDFQFQW